MASHAQPSSIVTDHSTGYAEQLFGAASNAVGIVDVSEAAVPPSAFLPRSARWRDATHNCYACAHQKLCEAGAGGNHAHFSSYRASLTSSLRLGDSPKVPNIFLPGAHRADSLELMLAGISPRFSIPKPSEGAFSTAADAVPLQSHALPPAASASGNISGNGALVGGAPGSAPGTDSNAARQDDIPRTFSGKVRKLKRHRIASASRLRQSQPTDSQQAQHAQQHEGQQAQHAQQREAQQAQQQQQRVPEPALPQLHNSGGSLKLQPAQHAAHVHPQHAQHVDLGFNFRAAQPAVYAPEDLLSIAQQHRLSPTGRHAASRHTVPAVQPVASSDSNAASQQAVQDYARAGLQHAQQGEPGIPHHHYNQQQPQQQQPQQQQYQQGLAVLQQSQRGRGNRHRPTADAASLACVGKVVRAREDEQGRMARSGPLQQPHEEGDIASVPALFEPYQVKPRGWGTGTLDRKMASLDRMFQKLPPGDNRRRSRLEAVSCSAPALPGVMPHQHAFVLTPGSAALPSELSLNPQLKLSPQNSVHRPQALHAEPSLNPQLSLSLQSSMLKGHPLGSTPELSLKAQLSLSAELSSHPQHSWQAQQPMSSRPAMQSQQPMPSQGSIHSQQSLSLRPLQSGPSTVASLTGQTAAGSSNSQVQLPRAMLARQGLTPSPASFEFQLPGTSAQHAATAKLSHRQQQPHLNAAVQSHRAQPAAASQAQPAALQQQPAACGLGAHPSGDGPELGSASGQQRPSQQVQSMSQQNSHPVRPVGAMPELSIANVQPKPTQQQSVSGLGSQPFTKERVQSTRQAARGARTSIEDFSSMQSQLNQLEQQLHRMPDAAARGSRPQTAETKS